MNGFSALNRIRRPLKIALAASLVAAASVWLCGKNLPDAFSLQPHYEGHRLSYWVRHWRFGNWGVEDKHSVIAVQSMGSAAVPYLTKWVCENDTDVGGISGNALSALRALGPVASPGVPDLIRNIGIGSRYPMEALVSIGSNAVPGLATELVRLLPEQDHWSWRRRGRVFENQPSFRRSRIVEALSQIGTNAEEAIPALAEACRQRDDWRFGSDPFTALVMVGKHQPEVVTSILVGTLTNFSIPPRRRDAAADALALLGPSETARCVPLLEVAIKCQAITDYGRSRVARALAAMEDPAPTVVVPLLLSAFTNTGEAWRDPIADSLARFGTNARPALRLLREAQESQFLALRIRSTLAIKRIEPEETNALVPVFRDLGQVDRTSREQCISALEELGPSAPEAFAPLMACLSHPSASTRAAAIKCLSAMGCNSDEFISDLYTNAADNNPSVAEPAVTELGRQAATSEHAFRALLQLMFPSGNGARGKAKYLLLDVSRTNPGFLQRSLGDGNPFVRKRARMISEEIQ